MSSCGSHLDIAFVHDLSPDFAWFPDGGWEKQYEIARKGAFPTLSKMRDGIIRAWSVGVKTPDAILKVIEDADPDVCLCARQYSLIEHANALNQVLPAVRAKKVSLVLGSTLNAGLISGSPRYNYGKENFKIPPEVNQKLARFRSVAQLHGVDLRTAALQFSAAASETVAILVGAASNKQIEQDWNSMQIKIPREFWTDLKKERLIEEKAPTPSV